MTRLETRQAAERSELFMAQHRLTETIARISAIEMNSIKDSVLASKKKKENEAAYQRSKMKQQKESDFLREMQLCKARQMARTAELEINQAEEMEELLVKQKQEEFEVTAKQALAEGEVAIAIENQRSEIETTQLFEKQKIAREQMQRAQRKQAKTLSKQQKMAARAREKIVLAENPIIKGDSESGNISSSLSDGGSHSALSSMRSSVASSIASSAAPGEAAATGEVGDSTDELRDVSKEAQANSQANKSDPSQMTDSQKELQVIAEQGRERLRTMMKHHHAALNELRLQHRNQVNMKQKEHHRKTADLNKENEEEIEQLKQEQVAMMEELVASQMANEEEGTEVSTNLALASLPFHVVADLHAGRTPTPVKFKAVSAFNADIPNINILAAKLSPAKFMSMLSAVQNKVNGVLKSHGSLFVVDSSDAHVWIAASGLLSDESASQKDEAAALKSKAGGVKIAKTSNDDEDEEEVSSEADWNGSETEAADVEIDSGVAPSVLASTLTMCAVELSQLDFSDISELAECEETIKLRVGVHSGSAIGGLIGKKAAVYALIGDAVAVSAQLCASGEPGRVHVSPCSHKLLQGEFEVEENGANIVINNQAAPSLWIKTA